MMTMMMILNVLWEETTEWQMIWDCGFFLEIGKIGGGIKYLDFASGFHMLFKIIYFMCVNLMFFSQSGFYCADENWMKYLRRIWWEMNLCLYWKKCVVVVGLWWVIVLKCSMYWNLPMLKSVLYRSSRQPSDLHPSLIWRRAFDSHKTFRFFLNNF